MSFWNITANGVITLASDDASVGALAGSTLTLSGGQLIGGGLIFEGQGTLILGEALPGGNLISEGGTITLTTTNAVPNLGIAGGGTIASGGNPLTINNQITSYPSPQTNHLTGTILLGLGSRPITVNDGPAAVGSHHRRHAREPGNPEWTRKRRHGGYRNPRPQ